MVAKDFPIRKGWQWFFYVLGWIGGALNLVFWIVQLIAYAIQQPRRFFGPMFHRIVMYWGMVTLAVLVLAVLFLLTILAWLVPVYVQTIQVS